jgi:hypothetical protein
VRSALLREHGGTTAPERVVLGRTQGSRARDWGVRRAACPRRRASVVEDRQEVEPAQARGVGARSLSSLGVDLHAAREAVETIVGRVGYPAGGEVPPPGWMLYTPRVRKVIGLAIEESGRSLLLPGLCGIDPFPPR